MEEVIESGARESGDGRGNQEEGGDLRPAAQLTQGLRDLAARVAHGAFHAREREAGHVVGVAQHEERQGRRPSIMIAMIRP